MKRNITAFARRTQVALLLLLICIGFNTIRAQTLIAGWDFSPLSGGACNYGPSTLDTTMASDYVTSTGLTRGTGVLTNCNNVATRAWGGVSWTSADEASAASAGDYVSFTVKAKSGYVLSLTSINPFDYRRSSAAGPHSGSLQYSIDGTNFTHITSFGYNTGSGGGSIASINLSAIANLQNVPASITVTFRIINWGATHPDGVWYLFDRVNSTANDFALNGTIAEAPSNYYRSVASGNWSTVSIWESGPTINGPWLPALAVPTVSASGVEIQGGYTVTMDGNQTINGVLKLTSGVLNINGNTLILNGTTSRTSGTITGSTASNLTIGGAAGSLYFTSGGTNNYLKDLVVAGSATIANALNIDPLGSVTANGTLTANGFVTMKSNANGTARIAPSNGTISGEVVVERYISARRSWRLLSVPTTSTQTINQAWQEGVFISNVSDSNNPNPGYGTHITFTTGAPGYDAGPRQNPSIFRWSNGWVTIPSTHVPLSNELGYFLFVRGPRSTNMQLAISAPTAPTILRSRGTVRVGSTNVSVSSAIAGGYVLIPNPYVSPISIAGPLGSANINPNEYARWDESIGGTFGVGGWVSVLSGTVSNQTTRFPDAVATSNLQTGESFIGKLATSATNATVSYAEGNKLTSQFLVFRPVPKNVPEVHAQLFALTDSTITNLDGTAVQFGIFASRHARKFVNIGENIYIQNDSIGYAIESKEPLRGTEDSSCIRLTRLTVGKRYSILLSTNAAFDRGMRVFLKDRRSDSLAQGSYDFVADSTAYSERFVLVYQRPSRTGGVHAPVSSPRMVTMSPNPVSGRTQLRAHDLPYSGMVTIADLSGRVIATRLVTHGVLDCMMIPPGTYVCTCPGQGSIIFTTRR